MTHAFVFLSNKLTTERCKNKPIEANAVLTRRNVVVQPFHHVEGHGILGQVISAVGNEIHARFRVPLAPLTLLHQRHVT